MTPAQFPPPARLARRRAVALLVCLVSLSACEDSGAAGTVTPGGQGGVDSGLRPDGDFEGESMDELSLRLDRLVQGREALLTPASADPGRCEELCELSRSICEVKTKMCEIADARVADDEYQGLCRKAKQRCQDAAQSCTRCVEHHQRASGEGLPAASCGDSE